jgi:hypothetical protein
LIKEHGDGAKARLLVAEGGVLSRELDKRFPCSWATGPENAFKYRKIFDNSFE